MIFEGEGRITEYTGGYEDWIRQRPKPEHFREIPAEPKPVAKPEPTSAPKKAAKFPKKEQRELEELPKQIEQWETEKSALAARLWEPDLYQKSPDLVPQLKAELAALDGKITIGYARWEALEEKRLAVEGQPPA